MPHGGVGIQLQPRINVPIGFQESFIFFQKTPTCQHSQAPTFFKMGIGIGGVQFYALFKMSNSIFDILGVPSHAQFTTFKKMLVGLNIFGRGFY